MNIQITRITPTKYSFKANGYEFFANTNANSGAWDIPSFVKTDYGVLRQNTAKLAHSQVEQFLRKNPLYLKTNKVDGATNKPIFTPNPAFR